MEVCFYPLLFPRFPPLKSDILPDVCHRVTHAPPCSWICFGQIHLKVSSVRVWVCACVLHFYYLLGCKYTYKTRILKEVAVCACVCVCVWPTATCHTFDECQNGYQRSRAPGKSAIMVVSASLTDSLVILVCSFLFAVSSFHSFKLQKSFTEVLFSVSF